MKIYHASLPRCAPQVAPGVAIDSPTVALVLPWLDQMLASGERQPLAFAGVSHFSASAEERNGALLVTLWSPLAACHPGLPYRGKTEMLAAFGVAADEAGGEIFWTPVRDTLAARVPPRPSALWSQAHPLDALAPARPKALGWLAQLQGALATSWLRRTAASQPAAAARFGGR